MRGMASRALDPRFFLGTSNPGTKNNLPEDEDFSGPDFGVPGGSGNYSSALSPIPAGKRNPWADDEDMAGMGVPGGTGRYSSALSPTPAGPSFEGTQEYKDFSDVGSRLRAALQPNQVSMPRAIIGALLSRRNPMLASVITGDFQRQRQIQPLEQQFGLLGNIIAQNRAMQKSQLDAQNIQSEIQGRQDLAKYHEGILNTKAEPPAKTPTERDIEYLQGQMNPETGKPYTYHEAYQTTLQTAQDAKPDKQLNAVEGVKQQLLDAMNKGDKPAVAKLGKQLEALSDPTGDKAAMRALTMESVRQRIAEKNAKDTSLSPKAQQVLMETEPTLQQVDQLIAKLEPMRNDNSTRLTLSRIGYALGKASPVGSLADDISKLELDRVVAGARVLKGSSRAYQALELAMKHAPNAWVDTPQLMYNKLTNIRQNLADVENDAKNLGTSKLSSAAAETATSSNQAPGGKYKRSSPAASSRTEISYDAQGNRIP